MHEVAQAGDPGARVVYVDNDPLVFSRDAILRMFNGHELVEPGLVLVSYWRPDGGEPGPDADRAWAYGGVASV